MLSPFQRGAGMRILAFVLLIIAQVGQPALAVEEVGGVQLPTSSMTRDGTELQLNGAGLRTRFFVSVYTGALYVEDRSADAATLRDTDQAARMEMHFLRDGIEQHQINDAWRDGLAANNDADVLAAIEDRMGAFLALTPADGVGDGDVLSYEYVPGDGTQMSMNGAARGVIPGHDFFAAILSTWIGDEPPSRRLRAGVLGQ